MSDNEYVPGECNIGKAETRKRYKFGIELFIVSIIFISLALYFDWSDWMLLISFLPLILGFEGLYQGKLSFCASFANKGMYDVSVNGNNKVNIIDEDYHKKDLKTARRIHIYSAVSAAIITIIIYLLASSSII